MILFLMKVFCKLLILILKCFVDWYKLLELSNLFIFFGESIWKILYWWKFKNEMKYGSCCFGKLIFNIYWLNCLFIENCNVL